MNIVCVADNSRHTYYISIIERNAIIPYYGHVDTHSLDNWHIFSVWGNCRTCICLEIFEPSAARSLLYSPRHEWFSKLLDTIRTGCFIKILPILIVDNDNQRTTVGNYYDSRVDRCDYLCWNRSCCSTAYYKFTPPTICRGRRFIVSTSVKILITP